MQATIGILRSTASGRFASWEFKRPVVMDDINFGGLVPAELGQLAASRKFRRRNRSVGHPRRAVLLLFFGNRSEYTNSGNPFDSDPASAGLTGTYVKGQRDRAPTTFEVPIRCQGPANTCNDKPKG